MSTEALLGGFVLGLALAMLGVGAWRIMRDDGPAAADLPGGLLDDWKPPEEAPVPEGVVRIRWRERALAIIDAAMRNDLRAVIVQVLTAARRAEIAHETNDVQRIYDFAAGRMSGWCGPGRSMTIGTPYGELEIPSGLFNATAEEIREMIETERNRIKGLPWERLGLDEPRAE